MIRNFLSALWLAILALALYGYFFHPTFIQNEFAAITHHSIYFGYFALLVLGIIRGFTLVPVTYLIILGLLFFPPLPLLIIILVGVLFSSATVYYFFDFLQLQHYFEKNHAKQIERIKGALEKNELLIITLWSSAPFLPTDLICYVCGSLEVDIKKFLLGILIGEGITCYIYIFFGQHLLNYFQFLR